MYEAQSSEFIIENNQDLALTAIQLIPPSVSSNFEQIDENTRTEKHGN